MSQGVLYHAPAAPPRDARVGYGLIALGVVAMLVAFAIVLRAARRRGPGAKEGRDE